MNWILLAVSAYFILALVNLADKFILDKVLPSSKAYTFFIGILGLLVFVLAPWFLEWPGAFLFILNILVGAIFPIALLLMYNALKRGEASQVITLIGGLVPVFTLLLSMGFLGERFGYQQSVAILFLLVGTFLIAWFPSAHHLWHKVMAWFKIKAEDKKHGIILAVAAAFVFAVFFVANKALYSEQAFMSAFIWIRLGTALAVLAMLLDQDFKQEILKKGFNKVKGHNKYIFLANQGLAAIGFLLQNYAIFLGSVVVVSALQGVQYAFLLAIGGVVTIFFPKIIKENITAQVVLQKILAVAFISLGLYLIAS